MVVHAEEMEVDVAAAQVEHHSPWVQASGVTIRVIIDLVRFDGARRSFKHGPIPHPAVCAGSRVRRVPVRPAPIRHRVELLAVARGVCAGELWGGYTLRRHEAWRQCAVGVFVAVCVGEGWV